MSNYDVSTLGLNERRLKGLLMDAAIKYDANTLKDGKDKVDFIVSAVKLLKSIPRFSNIKDINFSNSELNKTLICVHCYNELVKKISRDAAIGTLL